MDFLDDSMRQLSLPGMEGMVSGTAPKPKAKAKKETTADVLRSGQLPMFLTPKEIQDNYYPLPGDYLGPGETRDELWKRKAKEAREGSAGDARVRTTKETLAQSIAREGVRNPVTLGTEADALRGADKPFVFGGHHRIAAAREINPNMLIPVTNSDTFRSSTTAKKWSQEQGNQFQIGSGDKVR